MREKTVLAVLVILCGAAFPVLAQTSTALEDGAPPYVPSEPGMATLDTDEEKDTLFAELYGFVQTDAGYNFGRINPDWFDVVRPSQLPAYENQYGEDGDTFFSVRQTRFGIKAFLPAGDANVRGIFEWELFGVGVDAGQTTIRLRHAYGQYKHFGAGQYWSPFMDIDVFPNSLEYWGPTGMAFYRNVQIRYMPLMGKDHVSIALERPGGSGDGGTYNDVLEERGIKARFPMPDLSAEWRHNGDWGYFEVAGIVRRMEWDDVNSQDQYDLSGNAVGWGLNLSTNLKVGANGSTIRAAFLYGEGVENYMNDSTADIAVVENPGDPTSPLTGELIPVWGGVLFYDINWNAKWTTAVGFSLLSLDYDGTAAAADTYVEGRYALLNLQYHPADKVMYGAELQYGGRKNFSDGWDYDTFRVQFSFRYKYSIGLGGK